MTYTNDDYRKIVIDGIAPLSAPNAEELAIAEWLQDESWIWIESGARNGSAREYPSHRPWN